MMNIDKFIIECERNLIINNIDDKNNFLRLFKEDPHINALVRHYLTLNLSESDCCTEKEKHIFFMCFNVILYKCGK